MLVDSWKSMNTNRLRGKVVTEIRYLKPIEYPEYENLSRDELCELVKGRIHRRRPYHLSLRGLRQVSA